MMNDAIEVGLGLPTVIGTTFSVEVGLVMVGLLRSDVVGVEMTATGRLGTRDRNSGIVGAMLLPLGFHRETALLMPLGGDGSRGDGGGDGVGGGLGRGVDAERATTGVGCFNAELAAIEQMADQLPAGVDRLQCGLRSCLVDSVKLFGKWLPSPARPDGVRASGHEMGSLRLEKVGYLLSSHFAKDHHRSKILFDGR